MAVFGVSICSRGVRDNHPMRSFRLTIALATVFAALCLLSIGFAAWKWDQAWVQTWMPGVIVEWGGLFVAVLLVGYLVDRARQADSRERRSSLRKLAGERLRLALDFLFRDVVGMGDAEWPYSFDTDEYAMSASEYIELWGTRAPGYRFTRNGEAMIEFAETLESAQPQIAAVRSDFTSGLDEVELAELLALELEIDRWIRVLRFSADPGPEDWMASDLGDACQSLAPYLARAVTLYGQLTGRELSPWDGHDDLARGIWSHFGHESGEQPGMERGSPTGR